jgi:pimeloyl-ACP methyl ester carboxylesterase
MTTRETVILVPGLLCDADVWTDQIAALSPLYEVIVPDLTRHDSLQGMAAHVLDGAPERFSIIGHSMGGRVTLEVFRLAPDRVARIGLLDTGVHPAPPEELPKRQAMLDISAGQGMTALADAWLPPMVRPGLLDTDPALRTKLYAMIERMTPAIHRQQITALINRPDATPLLSQITCPALVGVGELDQWSPPEQHVPIAEAIAGAAMVVFEGAGHMAPMEAPDAVNAALLEWMARPVGE